MAFNRLIVPVLLVILGIGALLALPIWPDLTILRYFLAFLPILFVLCLMIFARWRTPQVGLTGLIAGIVVASLSFGLTPDVLWVSQLKGLMLSIFVLAVLWPALLLYNVADQMGGVRALVRLLNQLLNDRGLLWIILAWAFSSALEGLAGFGLPIAIVAPMLVGLGVEPVIAVAAVAIGHSWAVTFGDMGVIFQTLTGVVHMDGGQLAPLAALVLGIGCLACGAAVARLLNQDRLWLRIGGLAVLMGGTQYMLAVTTLAPLAGFGAGMAGVLGGMALVRTSRQPDPCPPHQRLAISPPAASLLASYGALAGLMTIIALVTPLHDFLSSVLWQPGFPEVTTRTGFVTAAGLGTAIRPLVHPGTAILIVTIVSYLINRRLKLCAPETLHCAAQATARSALPASVGIIMMVGLSALMEHCGMTVLLAQGVTGFMGAVYPLFAPLVGILGAFATGSNNNSNVLFGSLQKNAGLLLSIDPRVLVAGQTAGGAIGGMLAPAKIAVGCTTLGLTGRDGDVLRRTVPYGLAIGLGLGLLTLILAQR